jgi:large repetitive protein
MTEPRSFLHWPHRLLRLFTVLAVTFGFLAFTGQPASASGPFPDTPTGFSATFEAPDKIQLSWNSISYWGWDVFDYNWPCYGGVYRLSHPVTGATLQTSSTSYTISGVPAGTYTVDLMAVGITEFGGECGGFTQTSNSVTVGNAPAQPAAPSAVGGDASAAVSWSAPSSPGSSIIDYTLTAYNSSNSSVGSVVVSGTSTTYTGLTNGSAYTFKVIARNGVGTSIQSAASNSVTPAGVPATMIAPTAVRGDTQATVSFVAPNANGSAITGYSITAYSGGTAVSTTAAGPSATSVTVTALTNGTAYTFKVKATNGVGDSVLSPASAPTTPAGVPFAPSLPSAVRGDEQATVTFSAPGNNGAALTSYTVTASPGGAATTVTAPASSAVVPGLTNGTAYTFTVVATNAVGSSSPSTASTAVTPAGVPGTMNAPTGMRGDTQAVISFVAPSDNGDAISAYRVIASPGGAFANVVSGATSATVTGLTNGTDYTFQVRATNGVGNSILSPASAVVTPSGVPFTMVAPTVTAASESATISFVAPGNNGAVITQYTVAASPGGRTVTGTASSLTMTGLTNGTPYAFTVTATNLAGTSLPSPPSAPVIPLGPPAQMAAPTAVAGEATATVTFAAPSNDGGTSIIGYTITSSPGGITTTAAGFSTSAVVAGLTNGTQYTFTVTATNRLGESISSPPSNPVTPAGVPSTVTAPIGTPGDSQVSVAFVPTSANGSPITAYTVTAYPGGATFTGTTSPILATGLANGTAYSFRITATNALGTSVPSALSAPVTPSGAPATMVAPTAVAGDQKATVSFVAPSSGGSPIIDYSIVVTPGGAIVPVASTQTSAMVTGLTNGTAYTFKMIATNAIGSSAASPASPPVIPAGVPFVVADPVATRGDSSVSISFTAPNNNGAVITSYNVTTTPGGAVTTGTSSPVVMTGLDNGSSYRFVVTATNAVGTSLPSASTASVTPAAVPSTMAAPIGTSGDASVSVAFAAPSANGAAITGYNVTASPGGATASGTATPVTVNSLTNGTAYTFVVTATNGAGTSIASPASAAVTPAKVPAQMAKPTAARGNQQVTVNFVAPDAGGNAITGYTVVATPGGATANALPGDTSAIVTGLTNGAAYTFKVRATNGIGNGPFSVESDAIVPADNPARMQAPVATFGNRSASVAFEAPADNGSRITGYRVTAFPGGTVFTGTTSPILVTGLTNGTAYVFTAVAINDVGPSLASPVSNSTAPTDVPETMTAPTAVRGDTAATVSFTTPADGGSPITGYTVTASPGGATASGSTTPMVVLGLVNGTSYTFRVTARNAAGPSALSPASNAVIPAGVPFAPVAPTAAAGNNQATVSFSEPANNGSPVTGYTVTALPGGEVASGSTSPLTVTGLTNGTAYTFKVTATNVVGTSAPSLASDPVIVGAPSQPDRPTAVGRDRSAQVSFVAPNANGRPITGYRVTSSPGGFVAAGSASPITVTGLTNGTAYTFTVTATNVTGKSAESLSSNEVTPAGTPTSVPPPVATAGDARALVAFDRPDTNGAEIEEYEVIATPGGHKATGTASPIMVPGLTNGTTYKFSVVAKNVAGTSQVSVLSNEVTPLGGRSLWKPLPTPARLLDTRSKGVTAVVTTGRVTVNSPADGAALNVTVSGQTGAGFVTVWPCDKARPNTSNVNFRGTTDVANSVNVSPGADGSVCLFSSVPTHLIVDQVGSWSTGGGFVGQPPDRMADTRNGLGKVVSAEVPGFDSTKATLVNITVDDPKEAGFVTVWPCAAPKPTTSNLNFQAGETRAAAAIVKPDVNGKMCMASSTQAFLIMDRMATLPGARVDTSKAGRVLDVREQPNRMTANTVVNLVASSPKDRFVNITVVDAPAAGFASVWGDKSAKPETSNVNYGANQPSSNTTVIAADHGIAGYASSEWRVIVDLQAEIN